MDLIFTFLIELEESVPDRLLLWHLIAMLSPEVPVESYTAPVAFHPESFVVLLGLVFHTLPENAGVLAKPFNARNRWLKMPKKDFETGQSGDSVSPFIQCQWIVGV